MNNNKQKIQFGTNTQTEILVNGRVNELKSTSGRKRMKVPRKPGFSMMKWHQCLRAKKPIQPPYPIITKEELKKHNKTDDMWMALDGFVYDITEFQYYHPGGEAILQQTSGRDGTALFQKYHAWINIDGLIKPFIVGIYR